MMALLSEVLQTTERISQIVGAVKSYTYLDQAPLLEVDIHEGLENTLVIMQHKLKKGVTIKREYSPDLPRIEAYASELNQVWTNIIDNAIDAMNGKGEIKIKTYEEDQHVIVEITDNGPGIPQDIQPRIFEPFFTTKAPGHGTGLGFIFHTTSLPIAITDNCWLNRSPAKQSLKSYCQSKLSKLRMRRTMFNGLVPAKPPPV